MQLGRLVVALIFLIEIGASPIVGMEDSFDKTQYRLAFNDKLRIEVEAPIIVQGRVLEIREVGRPRISSGDSRVKTQQTQIKIEVEQVLKGTVRENHLEFTYFTFSTSNVTDLGVPRYIPGVGQRRIYFLKNVDNSYRSVGDVIDYTLRVSSGLHVRGYCREKQPGCCLASLLLTPSPTEFDPGRFMVDLRQSVYVAHVLCPQEEHSLLEKLTKGPDQQIVARASELIAEGDGLSRGEKGK